MRLLPRFLQQDTHDLRRRHHHLSFFSELLPLTINLRRSSYRSRARVSRCLLQLRLQIEKLDFVGSATSFSVSAPKSENRNSHVESRLNNSCRWSSSTYWLVETERKASAGISFPPTTFFQRVVSFAPSLVLLADRRNYFLFFNSIDARSRASRMTSELRFANEYPMECPVRGFNLVDDRPRFLDIRRDRRFDRCFDLSSFRERSFSSLPRETRWRNVRRETRPSIGINCDADRTRRRNPRAYRHA